MYAFTKKNKIFIQTIASPYFLVSTQTTDLNLKPKCGITA